MASPVASHFVHRYNSWHLLRFLMVVACSIQLAACGSSKFISKQSDKLVLSDSNFTSAHVGISIYDPSSHKYLYTHQAEKYFIPASNTKLFTCYAAMKHLGDSLVGARIFNDEGNMYLFPTGDPTLMHVEFAYQPVLHYLKNTNVNKVTIVDNVWKENPLGYGWAWNDYNENYMAERSALPISGNIFSITGEKGKITSLPGVPIPFTFTITGGEDGFLSKVVRERDKNNFSVEFNGRKKQTFAIPMFTSDGETNKKILSESLGIKIDPLGDHIPAFASDPQTKVIHSQPTDSLLKPMMHRSDNFFAEQALLMVSNEMTGVMNDAKIIDSLLKTDLKDLPQKPRWVDGSGLSRYNLFSPNDMVAVLHKMKNEFDWNRITTILPTGGEGTLSNYYLGLKNRIFAKTGTLSNNIALSGFLITKQNKTLIFSVLVNNHMGSTTQIRKAVEKFLASVANNY